MDRVSGSQGQGRAKTFGILTLKTSMEERSRQRYIDNLFANQVLNAQKYTVMNAFFSTIVIQAH